jgi:hypothetical protein
MRMPEQEGQKIRRPALRPALAAAALLALGAPTASPARAPGEASGLAGEANVPDWSLGRNRGSDPDIEYFQGFARCIVGRWPEEAEALLESLPGSKAQSEVAQALMEEASACAGSGEIRMKAPRLRGAIAEALMKKGRTPRAPSWLSASDTGNSLIAKLWTGPEKGQSEAQRMRELSGRGAAYCAARESRPAAEALLRTGPGSRDEQAALMALNPALSRCLGRRNMRFEMAPSVRAYLAEALYWQRGLEVRA